jgi:phosphoribosylformylglycinamidine (FGAM) synthase PurS component
MATTTLLVSLKIPDATALTALRTLHEMGYKELKDLKREVCYTFTVKANEADFKKKIANVDILVNANKHFFSFTPKREGVKILVEDNEQGDGLLNTLKERLGIKDIQKVRQGTLWTFDVAGKKQVETAKKMAEELLANIHYQNYRVIE